MSDRIPVGAKVRVLPGKMKIDKVYDGKTGTVTEYGHPNSKWDHLVWIEDIEQWRWFKASELEVIDADPQP